MTGDISVLFLNLLERPGVTFHFIVCWSTDNTGGDMLIQTHTNPRCPRLETVLHLPNLRTLRFQLSVSPCEPTSLSIFGQRFKSPFNYYFLCREIPTACPENHFSNADLIFSLSVSVSSITCLIHRFVSEWVCFVCVCVCVCVCVKPCLVKVITLLHQVNTQICCGHCPSEKHIRISVDSIQKSHMTNTHTHTQTRGQSVTLNMYVKTWNVSAVRHKLFIDTSPVCKCVFWQTSTAD